MKGLRDCNRAFLAQNGPGGVALRPFRPEVAMCRALIALMVTLAVYPLGAGAQQPKSVPRIGILSWEGCPVPNSVFGQAMRDLGYTWGEKIKVVCGSADGSY